MEVWKNSYDFRIQHKNLIKKFDQKCIIGPPTPAGKIKELTFAHRQANVYCIKTLLEGLQRLHMPGRSTLNANVWDFNRKFLRFLKIIYREHLPRTFYNFLFFLFWKFILNRISVVPYILHITGGFMGAYRPRHTTLGAGRPLPLPPKKIKKIATQNSATQNDVLFNYRKYFFVYWLILYCCVIHKVRGKKAREWPNLKCKIMT